MNVFSTLTITINLALKRLFYLFIVAIVAFFLTTYIKNPQSYWIILSALSASFITAGHTCWQRIFIILVSGFIAAVYVFFAAAIATIHPPFVLAIYLAIIVMINLLISQRYPTYFIALFIINIIVILSGILSLRINGDLMNAISISYFIFLGFFIAAFFQLIFYRHFFQNAFTRLLHKACSQLMQLNDAIFTAYFRSAHSEHFYLLEKEIHERKKAFLNTIIALRDMVSTSTIHLVKLDMAKQLLIKLDLLYDMTLDCAQLRSQISDKTIFLVCDKELTGLATQLNGVFKQIRILFFPNQWFVKFIFSRLQRHHDHSHIHLSIQRLNEHIECLENHYHRVLLTVAREPLAFLIFIASLQALTSELNTFYALCKQWINP